MLHSSLHGWISINKPIHMSSADVLRHLKKAFSLKGEKLGHAGTLDPLASGILPIAFGEATKTIPYLVDQEKTYIFEVTWGKSTSTDDSEGEIIKESLHRPTENEIKEILPFFTGDILQAPPPYSAIKIKGIRACDRMRQGESITLEARPVKIKSLEILDIISQDQARFKVTCSKGVYIRSLARDMALGLRTFGFASMIHRSKVGPFTEENSLHFKTLAKLSKKALLEEYINAIGMVLDDIPAIQVSLEEAKRLRQGNSIALPHLPEERGTPGNNQFRLCFDTEKKLVAISEVKTGYIYPKRVFNY
jgi:tRNA pseudouridine55 synthase